MKTRFCAVIALFVLCCVWNAEANDAWPKLAEEENTIQLLPPQVRKLAKLLDGTLGRGENEGTFQATRRIRVGVMHMWADIAKHPLAIKNEPYNSRKCVDAELKKWSRKAPSFGKLYQDILKQYPKAHKSLAQYYESNFHMTQDESNATATRLLDIAFRTHFVFSCHEPEEGNKYRVL